jgi:hydrogenase maturation protein HypF
VASVQAKQTADCYRYAAGDRNIPPLLAGLLEHRISTAESTSAGRLFDAAASLLGLRDENGYEGECAIALENAAAKAAEIKTPKEVLREMRVHGWFREEDLVKKGSGRILLDQTAFVRAMTEAQAHGADSREVALAFHAALASCSVSVCEAIAEESGERRVALSGGVFANRILRDEMREGLTERGLDVYFNEQVPMNDGGIALGQALIAGRASVPADAAKAE